jgi:hypothetical protein
VPGVFIPRQYRALRCLCRAADGWHHRPAEGVEPLSENGMLASCERERGYVRPIMTSGFSFTVPVYDKASAEMGVKRVLNTLTPHAYYIGQTAI